MSDDLFSKPETALTVVEQPPLREPSRALVDLRHASMLLPAAQMVEALDDYWERRQTFFRWLLSKMVEGIHYGYPPGCKASTAKPEQWQAKPSLYKAGADLITDLMGTRAEYFADVEAWKQLGEAKGTYVFRCVIVSRSTGEILGEGRGAFKVGEKQMGENSAVKMAQKRSKVDATINAWGLSDLFTQDLEDPDNAPPLHENPKAKADAPKAAPRGERVNGDDLKALFAKWKSCHRYLDDADAASKFRLWIFQTTGIVQDDANKPEKWTKQHLKTCQSKIAVESGEPA